MKLTDSKKKQLLRKYHRNEKLNYHTENAIMLINVFGTKAGKNKAKEIKKQIDTQGYVNGNQSRWLYEHGHVHYRKIR